MRLLRAGLHRAPPLNCGLMHLDRRRVLFASLLAPWVPAILVALIAKDDVGSAGELYLLAGSTALSAYFGLALAGFPILYLLERSGRLTLAPLAIAGALASLFVLVLLMFVVGLLKSASYSGGVLDVLAVASIGVCVAVAFGLIAGVPLRRRPGAMSGGA